jgi:hypothetical protein
VECDALILAQGAVEILEQFKKHEHKGIAEATPGQRGHWVLAAAVPEHTCKARVPENLRFLCLLFWWWQREKHSSNY